MQNAEPAGGLIHVCHLSECEIDAGIVADRQVRNVIYAPALLRVQNRSDTEYLVPLVYLSDDIATKGCVDCIENPDGIESPSSKIDVAQSNGLLWRSGWSLKLNISRAGYGGDYLRYLRGLIVKLVEIVTVEIDDDGSCKSGNCLLNSLGKEGLYRYGYTRHIGERFPYLSFRGFRLFALQWFQIDLELAVVNTPGIFRLFGPPHTLRYRSNKGKPGERLCHFAPNSERFFDRCAGHRRNMHNEVPFSELGKKRSMQEWQK
jgi:hypothetical protein